MNDIIQIKSVTKIYPGNITAVADLTLSVKAGEFVRVLKNSSQTVEPPPKTSVWDVYGRPEMTVEAYAGYVRRTGDFPQK